ncbi:MAG: 50S ribosomal protein L23 [Chloroflexi bacterium]|jgi:large subunit ribosomal protein L23|nr:50S ribosomal protein L23 [Chloroflexota bacterium]
MHIYEVLKRPVLTEKTNYLADELHRYTFEVDRRATKQLVQRAVEEIFKVQVQRVNIMRVHGKTRRFGRLIGKTPEWKKAIVTLSPGDSISFFEGV